MFPLTVSVYYMYLKSAFFLLLKKHHVWCTSLVNVLKHFHIVHAPHCVVFTQCGKLFSLLLRTPEMCHTPHRRHKFLNLASSLRSLWVTHRYEVNLWECVLLSWGIQEQQRGRRCSALWVVSAYGRRRSSHSPRQTGLWWVARRPARRLY